jgi:hypothetical protein
VSESTESTSRSGKSALSWQKHLGLILGGATSILICLKLLAVANWDSNTAFGILAAAGTTNVLTGTLLAVLPVLYGYFFVFTMPRIEQKLRRRTRVERSAARLLETWPTVLLVVLVPAYLIVVILAMFIVQIAVRIWQSRQERKRSARANNEGKTEEERPSRFEMTSVTLAAVVMLSYSSLAIPWLPAEVANTEAGKQTVYVLDRSGDVVTILLADGRKLQQIDGASITGEYCQLGSRWWSAPAAAFLTEPRYPSCPD